MFGAGSPMLARGPSGYDAAMQWWPSPGAVCRSMSWDTYSPFQPPSTSPNSCLVQIFPLVQIPGETSSKWRGKWLLQVGYTVLWRRTWNQEWEAGEGAAALQLHPL